MTTTGAIPPERRRFRDVRHIEVTGSTNADVLELGRSGEPEGLVLVAGAQSAGRGRHDRRWLAAPGSALLASILLRPESAVADLVTAALALAANDAVQALGAADVTVKWPNDLIVEDERKLAGILAEADWSAPGGRVLVVAGIGINLRADADLPAEVAERAVALDELTRGEVDRDVLLDVLLDRFDGWYEVLCTDRHAVLTEWRRRCVTLGRVVRLDLGADDAEGTAVDIDDDGRLVLELADGTTRAFAAGDVVHLHR